MAWADVIKFCISVMYLTEIEKKMVKSVMIYRLKLRSSLSI